MIPGTDIGIRVGDYVESCLDMETVNEDDWYTGVVTDVYEDEENGWVEYLIQRRDSREGEGADGEWIARLTHTNTHGIRLIESISQRAKVLGFSLGDEIDVPEKYKNWECFQKIDWPITITSITTCDEVDPRSFCDGCPGLINGLCLGADDKFIAHKYVGEWNTEDN